MINYIIKKIKYLGILGVLRLLRDLLFSSIFVKTGSLVRHPFYIRRLGKLNLENDIRCGSGLVIDIISENAELTIGKNFKASYRLHIGCGKKILIGDNVLIGTDVYISDHMHGNYNGKIQTDPNQMVNSRSLSYGEIIIGNNVWIGDKVCILPGVYIGNNSIIGALSIVNKNVAANSIYGGVPAKKLKVYDFSVASWIKPE
jgi:lipopolysaccharide O-acetyltransferase